MPSSMAMPTEDDRRQDPRRACTYPLSLATADGTAIPCVTVDVSTGGMRVASASRIPLGPCDLVVSAPGDDVLALRGTVVEEMLDASTGEISARIVFLPSPATELERVVALADADAVAPRSSRRRSLVLAAALAVGVVIAGAAFVATRDESADGRRALATTVERADNRTGVVLGETAEQTSITSTMGPSAEGDVVRVQLHVTPEPEGTTLPIAVTIENRGDEVLRFDGGLRATVTATRSGAFAASATLTSSTTELAPGEVATVEGFLDFGATGEYDVAASTEVG